MCPKEAGSTENHSDTEKKPSVAAIRHTFGQKSEFFGVVVFEMPYNIKQDVRHNVIDLLCFMFQEL